MAKTLDLTTETGQEIPPNFPLAMAGLENPKVRSLFATLGGIADSPGLKAMADATSAVESARANLAKIMPKLTDLVPPEQTLRKIPLPPEQMLLADMRNELRDL